MIGPRQARDTSKSAAERPAAPQVRRRELDWLRALVVFGLIPFHTAVIFIGAQGDYVRNAQSSWLLARLVAFISFWGIPVLFFVSGAATRYSLSMRSNRRYVEERITRLLIPFVFAMLTIMPAQVYVGYLRTPGAHISFLRYYWLFMRSLLGVLHGVLPQRSADWIGHLWFIPPLLVISLAALPLFRFLRGIRGQEFVAALGAIAPRRWSLLLYGLPFGLSEVILRAGWPLPGSNVPQSLDNWPGFVLFALFYLGGYLVYDEARIQLSLRNQWIFALALGMAAWLLITGISSNASLLPQDSVWFPACARLLRGYVSWFWVAAIVGFGMRYLVSTGNAVRYITDAAFPIYVLHMPILTILGFFVVQWPVGIAVKFVVITAATLIITIALYELVIRRVAPLRFVFGLRVNPRRAHEQTDSTSALADAQRLAPVDGRVASPEASTVKPPGLC